MLPLLLIIFSLAVVLNFIWFNQNRQKNLPKLFAGIGFILSWAFIVMWFTSLAELWQLSLNTPQAHDDSIPAWSSYVLSFLRAAVYLLPVRRLALAVLYAMPFLLVPTAVALTKRLQTTSILIFSTWVNLLFFWMLVVIDGGRSSSFAGISIHGIVVLVTYVFALLALVRQRQFITFLRL
jgi:hypothetical protein